MPRLKHDLLNHLALKSAQEKLRLNAAKARKAEAEAPQAVVTNQYGRPIVAYADQPDLRESDLADINFEFESRACPHAAVLEYRPGFGSRWCKSKNLRDHWWFYNRGTSILSALCEAPVEILEQLSTPSCDIVALQGEMQKFISMEMRASLEAARDREISLRALDAVHAEELAEIEAEIGQRFLARILRRNDDVFGPDVKPEDVEITRKPGEVHLSDFDNFGI